MSTEDAIKEYQCPGCISGPYEECFEKSDAGIGCGSHYPATLISSIGKIMLGLGKGFNRVGVHDKMQLFIFDDYKSSDWKYDECNVPVWKYLNKAGHTIVRGLMPRINTPFIHLFLSDVRSEFECYEVTEDYLKTID